MMKVDCGDVVKRGFLLVLDCIPEGTDRLRDGNLDRKDVAWVITVDDAV